MKKYSFVLVLALFCHSSLTMMEKPKKKEVIAFNSLLQAVKRGDFKTAAQLVDTHKVPAAIASDISQEMEKYITGVSYNPKCISLKNLSLLTIIYWNFHDKFDVGQMVVNKKIVEKYIGAFTDMLQARFAIKEISLIDKYGADDDESMANNNSSALCCRVITGDEKKKNPTWSKHSFGAAVDINPVENPYIKRISGCKDVIFPANAKDCLDRGKPKKGMIVAGDACHKAFVSRGFQWGGDKDFKWGGGWVNNGSQSKFDYQHFDIDLKDVEQ